ncbi:hypothetical protein [Amycolatopsis sp. H20-H5]|uniref:hypothetical protein n=1 Tax=Amycolatopsis sp. H20-H5 TaxID=3046309 RepID=UPI002DB7D652|nr:hypothetical protein [Amycolatopsis sp. H20-H5]MEC3981291.1 hypothetical protein [Amycolatopsis sp. H20-H5]
MTVSQHRDGNTAYATASNTCTHAVRVRMIWAFAADGGCTSLPKGYAYTESRGAAALPPRPKVSEMRNC